MNLGTPQDLDGLVLAIVNVRGGPEYKERLVAIITDYINNRISPFTLSARDEEQAILDQLLRHLLVRRES